MLCVLCFLLRSLRSPAWTLTVRIRRTLERGKSFLEQDSWLAETVPVVR
jgi:hypothetical protein